MSPMAVQSETALVGEIKRTLTAFAAANPNTPLGTIYLVEGQSGGGTWGARLQQQLSVPVVQLDPLQLVNQASNLPEAMNGRFLSPVGLLAARADGPFPVNFVTPRQPKNETPKSARMLVLAGFVLLFFVAGAALALFFMNQQADASIAAIKRDRLRIQAETETESVNTLRRNALEKFQNSGVSWLDVFYDITSVAPDVDKLRITSFVAEQKIETVTAKPTLARTATATKPGAAAAKPATGSSKTAAAVPLKKNETVIKNTLTMTILSANDQLPQSIYNLFVDEKEFYSSPSTKTAVVSKTGTMTNEARSTTVSVDVLKRDPKKYARKLNAKFPVLPPTPSPDNPSQPVTTNTRPTEGE
jgi:hypothetical protein